MRGGGKKKVERYVPIPDTFFALHFLHPKGLRVINGLNETEVREHYDTTILLKGESMQLWRGMRPHEAGHTIIEERKYEAKNVKR